MEEKNHEVAEVIQTYVYREDEPIELIGIYEYSASNWVLFFSSLVVIGGIIWYWLVRKKNK